MKYNAFISYSHSADSDLARLVENRHEAALDGRVADVMTRDPTKTIQGALLADAVDLMVERKISELPVVDRENRPIGIIDITDVMSLLPEEHRDEQDFEYDVAKQEDPTTLPFRKRGA